MGLEIYPYDIPSATARVSPEMLKTATKDLQLNEKTCDHTGNQEKKKLYTSQDGQRPYYLQ